MDDDQLLVWCQEFEARLRPGFLVVDPDGLERVVRNVEMHDYCRAAEVLRRKVGRIDRFLSGEHEA